MSGTPGIGINNPEGFQNFVTPAQLPTIAVDQTVGDVSIPLSVFPFWRNDGGFRSYGGAKRISIFDAAVLEGVSTPDIPAITDQPIEAQGTFLVSNPDAQKLYKIVIRLRSASGDPNFRDFICEFRLVTPLEVPLNYTVWLDADIPNITYNGVDFFWSADATPTEIRLRDGAGSILVGNLAAPPFNAAAKAYLLRKMQSERDGILFVDFFAGGGVQATRRQVYHYYFDGVNWTFTKIRHRNFPSFDQYSGSDFGIAQANVDLPNSAAELSFIYNTYTYGQRFEEVIVVGRKGFLQIDPKLVLAGGSVDITPIVDFSIQAYWHKFDVTDQYITMIGITDSQVVYRQIPLWPTASHLIRIDAADYVPTSITPAPAEILQARLLFWPFIHFPNLETVFLNVPPGIVGADPAGGIYPDLLTINLYDGNNPVPVATYIDEVDLWNNLVAVRCPDQGLIFGCLDVRTLLTPTSPFFRIEAGVRTALSAPGIAYTFVAHYTLNVNGEPVLYTRDDFIPPLVVPVFNFDQWGRLTITWPATIVAITGPTVQFAGDVGTRTDPAPAGPFPMTVTYDLRSDVMSREASYVDVEFEALDTGGFTRTYTFRVPTLVNHQQLLGPTDINVYFAGNIVLFPTGSLTSVDTSQPVVIIGDVGQITFYDPQENVPYFTGQLGDGGERIFSNPLVPHAIVQFTDTLANACQVLIPNTFYDLREGEDESFVVASRAGGPVAGGLPSSAHNFTLPKGKVSLSAATIEFEDDGSGFSWNFQQWQIANGASLRRKIFNNTIVVATPYNIADVLTNARLNDYLIVTFKHREGFQRIGAYKITGDFEPAKRLDLEGFA